MFQPRGRFSDVAESTHPIRLPIVASRSAVLLESGILCSDLHNRDHWPYCRCSRSLAALTTLARSSVLLAPRAHTFLISPIQSATADEALPPSAHGVDATDATDAMGKTELPSFFILKIVKISLHHADYLVCSSLAVQAITRGATPDKSLASSL